jgi:hypothetical protein
VEEGFKVSVETDPETQAPEPGEGDGGGTLTGPWGLVEEEISGQNNVAENDEAIFSICHIWSHDVIDEIAR